MSHTAALQLLLCESFLYRHRTYHRLKHYTCCVPGSLLAGYDFSATSSLLSRISDFKGGTDDAQFQYFVAIANSDGLTGLIAAGSSIGATTTFCFLLFFGNGVPKNDEILISALTFFMGALLESLSGGVPWENKIGLIILITGRLLYGAAMALSFHSVPEYISEISPKIGRGSIGCLTEAMLVIGVCLGFLLGYLTSSENGFIITFRVGCLIALLMAILALYLPRSPQMLISSGADDDEVLNSIQYTRPTATMSAVTELKATLVEAKLAKQSWEKKVLSKLHSNGLTKISTKILLTFPTEVKVLLISRTLRRCLFLALLLVFLQQFSGQGAILYYSGQIFGEICPESTSTCIITFGMVKLFFVLVMIFVADSFGRRKFLIIGSSIMTLGLIMLCFGLSYQQYALALVGIYISVAANEISLATLLWVVLCEIFPQFVRSAAISIAIATFFAWSSIVVFIMPYISANMGLITVFITYTITAAISVLLLSLYVPETRGVDLEISYKLVNGRLEKTSLCCTSKITGDTIDLSTDSECTEINPLIIASTGVV